MTFSVQTAAFQGPLELLLNLIEERKLLINDISLVQVTDDYLNYVRQFDSFPMEATANFIVIASHLLLVKSRSLLPSLTLTADEESSIHDLERRLALLKRVRELSAHVRAQFGQKIVFAREDRRIIIPVFSPPHQTSTQGLSEILHGVLKRIPSAEALPKVIVRTVMSLEAMIDRLADRIKKEISISFKTFSGIGREDRVHVIVSFLALLELVKQGVVRVTQQGRGRDILLETVDAEVPRYGA